MKIIINNIQPLCQRRAPHGARGLKRLKDIGGRTISKSRAPHGARGLKDLSAALRQCLCLVALPMERAGWSIEANLGEKVKPICALRVYGEEIMSVI